MEGYLQTSTAKNDGQENGKIDGIKKHTVFP